MTRDEALEECGRRAAERPDVLWMPEERAPGDWVVVAAELEGLPERVDELTPEVQPPPVPPRGVDEPPAHPPRHVHWGGQA